jgi:hypothetical protein
MRCFPRCAVSLVRSLAAPGVAPNEAGCESDWTGHSHVSCSIQTSAVSCLAKRSREAENLANGGHGSLCPCPIMDIFKTLALRVSLLKRSICWTQQCPRLCPPFPLSLSALKRGR